MDDRLLQVVEGLQGGTPAESVAAAAALGREFLRSGEGGRSSPLRAPFQKALAALHGALGVLPLDLQQQTLWLALKALPYLDRDLALRLLPAVTVFHGPLHMRRVLRKVRAALARDEGALEAFVASLAAAGPALPIVLRTLARVELTALEVGLLAALLGPGGRPEEAAALLKAAIAGRRCRLQGALDFLRLAKGKPGLERAREDLLRAVASLDGDLGTCHWPVFLAAALGVDALVGVLRKNAGRGDGAGAAGGRRRFHFPCLLALPEAPAAALAPHVGTLREALQEGALEPPAVRAVVRLLLRAVGPGSSVCDDLEKRAGACRNGTPGERRWGALVASEMLLGAKAAGGSPAIAAVWSGVHGVLSRWDLGSESGVLEHAILVDALAVVAGDLGREQRAYLTDQYLKEAPGKLGVLIEAEARSSMDHLELEEFQAVPTPPREGVVLNLESLVRAAGALVPGASPSQRAAKVAEVALLFTSVRKLEMGLRAVKEGEQADPPRFSYRTSKGFESVLSRAALAAGGLNSPVPRVPASLDGQTSVGCALEALVLGMVEAEQMGSLLLGGGRSFGREKAARAVQHIRLILLVRKMVKAVVASQGKAVAEAGVLKEINETSRSFTTSALNLFCFGSELVFEGLMQQGPDAEELRLEVLQTTNLVAQQLFSHQKELKGSGFWLAADHMAGTTWERVRPCLSSFHQLVDSTFLPKLVQYLGRTALPVVPAKGFKSLLLSGMHAWVMALSVVSFAAGLGQDTLDRVLLSMFREEGSTGSAGSGGDDLFELCRNCVRASKDCSLPPVVLALLLQTATEDGVRQRSSDLMWETVGLAGDQAFNEVSSSIMYRLWTSTCGASFQRYLRLAEGAGKGRKRGRSSVVTQHQIRPTAFLLFYIHGSLTHCNEFSELMERLDTILMALSSNTRRSARRHVPHFDAVRAMLDHHGPDRFCSLPLVTMLMEAVPTMLANANDGLEVVNIYKRSEHLLELVSCRLAGDDAAAFDVLLPEVHFLTGHALRFLKQNPRSATAHGEGGGLQACGALVQKLCKLVGTILNCRGYCLHSGAAVEHVPGTVGQLLNIQDDLEGRVKGNGVEYVVSDTLNIARACIEKAIASSFEAGWSGVKAEAEAASPEASDLEPSLMTSSDESDEDEGGDFFAAQVAIT